ncbi:MAG: hypothetical protein Ct9H90mP13_04170 [Pseudomonadota bacterium]|nr:MAG: hypothetical protein Ct9H90mP13_04170 [Pseudomonadota bacterium]
MIKFDSFIQHAKRLGAKKIATVIMHVLNEKDESLLLKGKIKTKIKLIFYMGSKQVFLMMFYFLWLNEKGRSKGLCV